ncbi:MAG: TIGR04348 family glycosyltransferase [Planctomycetes bacterium]|nr:TIGR04348 family glycosyltransferase [Planctomycetota bacterium]
MSPPGAAARVLLVTPAARGSRNGNRITALRWAAHLRSLGLRPRLVQQWRGEPCELLVAIHAQKSAASVAAAAAALRGLRVVVLLAGTDVYPEFTPDPQAQAALERASAIVALQPDAIVQIPGFLRAKARTIVQSATAFRSARAAGCRACVLAHLRPVKAPLLALEALRLLPAELRCELLLAGSPLEAATTAAVRAAVAADPRARWLGELPRTAARRLLASSHLCIVPSAAEGGANVVSEAIAAGTPLLATAVPGNLGLLGADWPGRFPPGDAAALAALWRRSAEDPGFYAQLLERTRQLQPMVAPARERAALAALLTELGVLPPR